MNFLIEMIAAVSDNNVIGYKGKMPWGRIPRDLAHFKKITKGHTVVMGYKTLVSIGGALPERTNLVLTSEPEKVRAFPGCIAVSSPDEILKRAKYEKVFVIGGEAVYRQFLPYTDVIHLTRIQVALDGDANFPWLSPDEWHRIRHTFHHPSEKNKYPLTFETWVRRECVEERKAA
ncbi:MAG: dihydrofolate reductase [Patescibacteria group bacterium]